MRRTQLIEWGVLTIGIIIGYYAAESLIVMAIEFLYQLNYGYYKISLFPLIGSFILYVVLFILIIRNSRKISVYLNGTNPDELLPIQMSKGSLTQVILMSLCIVTLLTTIPSILTYVFNAFANEIRSDGELKAQTSEIRKLNFKKDLIKSILSFVIIYFSKDITRWFIRKNELDELTFDSNPEK